MRVLTKPLAGLLCLLALYGSAWAGDEPDYYLERCTVHKGSLNLGFATAAGAKRRIRLGPQGMELGGNIKGDGPLSALKALQLEPVFTVHFVSGASRGFGSLTTQCRDKVRATAKQLALTVVDVPGG